MTTLPNTEKMPNGITLEAPRFVPRLVMTNELRAVLKNVIAQWGKRGRFEALLKYEIRPLDRLLFYGPPGNGKTMACYWIAKELGIPMFRVQCDALRGSCLGDSARAVAQVMEFLAARTGPALCLWDEVEAIFVDRKTSQGQCDREMQAALTIFMQHLDRWSAPILLAMATNLPEQLDAALLSRVEMKVLFPGPTTDQCAQAIAYWAELLHDSGGSEWGPKLTETLAANPPSSFREIKQLIGYAARDWVMASGKELPA